MIMKVGIFMKESNKEKGFTLIELLAVIVILAVIALIAVPVITSIISDSEQGALKTTVQNLISAVENNCNVERINDKSQTFIYKLTEQGVFPSVINLKGKLPTSGYVYVDGECNASAINLSNGEYYVNGPVEDIRIEKEAENISPVTGATRSYVGFPNGVDVPNNFDSLAEALVEVELVFTNSERNIVMVSLGYVSKELNINTIKSFAEELKTKELILNGVNLSDNVYYYIDYEVGYSYVFFNACSLSDVCGNTIIDDFEGFESDAAFVADGGIIHNF